MSLASFRFPSRWTPLPRTIRFPLSGRARDFHPLDYAHVGRTRKSEDFWSSLSRASCRIRTNDPEITNHVLWPTELKRRVGKLTVSRRYNQLPLLRSSPGGFEGSWPYSTYPCTVELFAFAGAKIALRFFPAKLFFLFFCFYFSRKRRKRT